MWETGCWEPREDQLSWQQYELGSEIYKNVLDKKQVTEQEKSEETEAVEAANEVTDNDDVHKLTEKLTTQIVGRKAPIITNTEMQRTMVTAMSQIPWTEQGYIKQRIDTSLSVKRPKRLSVNGDSIRQSNITSLLDLKQTGKSVKYMKQAERDSLAKTSVTSDDNFVEGSITGEWELEHSYMCSVCGVEYDDMLEILHHKWESHPHCLVSHLSVRDNIVKPPDLMVPQVGPSTVTWDLDNNDQDTSATLCDFEYFLLDIMLNVSQ